MFPALGDLYAAFGGRFCAFKLLGRGGEGAVFSAHDRAQRRDVALKLARDTKEPGLAERFEREHHILAATRSPLLVTVYSSGRVTIRGPDCGGIEHFWYSMERCRSSVRRELPGMSLGERLAVVTQTLDGLSLLHAKNIAHRDIKPENLFLTMSAGRVAVKIGDFGIATVTRVAPNAVSGVVHGSPVYLAPERWAGDQDADWRPADQYGAGVTIFELLSAGLLPLDFAVGALRAHARGAVRSLAIPELRGRRVPRVDEVIERILRKRPEDRFASVAECKLALCAALAMEGVDPARIAR